jgi:hypothetical protein
MMQGFAYWILLSLTVTLPIAFFTIIKMQRKGFRVPYLVIYGCFVSFVLVVSAFGLHVVYGHGG